ncbi:MULTISPECIES: thiamine pyrophosphate-binding protein [unclassified Beijerinckia]|uniref:thiamine pyrophosphate-binding protein n=1 Tax=unclassified Beijerinckia TaxID=2638183 RepID=UPI00089AE170|nr:MULTISPECIES: thiamine pyrophosphate-binding protein [unclassified Beijerinckia]MDH7796726.1 thiamine pyrophosphate-dependent acetolactate synthase large subunit-like protein [Beijerinckia sp. GAS462]SEC57365.1 benzoylformate decarboxylase [Beijerinckia sp. 28-YEA-48]
MAQKGSALKDVAKAGSQKSGVALATARFDDKDTLVRPSNAQMGWASDAMAEMLRRLDLRYIALTPGASYRGLHDSLVNYLGNRDPQMLVCLHEEHAVGIAQGYAKVTEKPMAVALHSNVGLMHATMAIFNAWCARNPIVILGATGPGDADERRPWIDWIHTAKDQGALIRHYTKWDDEPRSAVASVESLTRAWQIAATPPYGPTYVCLDVGLQESKLEKEIQFPDLERFAPGEPPAPSTEAIERAAKLLAEAKRPLILMGRVSRGLGDWQARIDLAEAIGGAVLTDMKTSSSFPTEHPLHVMEPRHRPSPESTRYIKEADVILSLDWIDLRGTFILTLGKDAPVEAKVIHCSVDDYLHNGWSMDHFGLPPVDLKILSTPDQMIRPLTEAVRRLRGNSAKTEPKWPVRQAKPLSAPRAEGMMSLRDLALVVREFCDPREVTMAGYALGWPADTVNFRHPLDYMGIDGGGGVGAGPSNAIGTALAIKNSGRFPMTVMGDGDFAMGCNAFWTAAHMGIPLLVVIANNRVYYNDVAHQERMAVVRDRPVENKFVGQEMVHPTIDLVGLAKAQGLDGEGPVESAAAFREALKRGEAVVKAGGVYVIDARVDVGAPGEGNRGHTGGRKD